MQTDRLARARLPAVLAKPLYLTWLDRDPDAVERHEMPIVWRVLDVLRGLTAEAYELGRDQWMDVIREVPGYSEHVAIDSHTKTAARIRRRIYLVALGLENDHE